MKFLVAILIIFLSCSDNTPKDVNIAIVPYKIRKTMRPRLQWEKSLPGEFVGKPFHFEDKLYFATRQGFIYCVDYDGKIIWKRHTRVGMYTGLYVNKYYVWQFTDRGKVYTYSRHNGKYKWGFKIGYVDNRDAVIGHKGRIYVPTVDRGLVCLNDKGYRKWRYRWAIVDKKPIIHKWRIYFADRFGKVICLNAWNGRKIWRVNLKETPSTGAGFDGESLYFGLVHRKIRQVSIKNGEIIRTFKLDFPVTGTPIFYKGIIFGLTGNEIYAIKGERILWISEFSEMAKDSLVIENNKLYFNTRSFIYSYYLNGKQGWVGVVGGNIEGHILKIGNSIYVGTDYGFIYRFNDFLF